jgi:hypothetical protein
MLPALVFHSIIVASHSSAYKALMSNNQAAEYNTIYLLLIESSLLKHLPVTAFIKVAED